MPIFGPALKRGEAEQPGIQTLFSGFCPLGGNPGAVGGDENYQVAGLGHAVKELNLGGYSGETILIMIYIYIYTHILLLNSSPINLP